MKPNDKKAASAKSEVATKSNTEVGQVLDFASDAGQGLEGSDKSSFAIPFLTVLQGLSPQLETIDGAKPGKILNTITNELFDEVLVIPCAYQRRFIRWASRSSGGGYKGDFNPIDVETGKVDGLQLLNGMYLMDVPQGAPAFDPKGLPLYDHLSDTRNHFVLFQSKSGAWQPALVSLASTQIKKSKRWMSRIQGLLLNDASGKAFNPPSFSHVYKLKSIKEENSKGSWHGVDVDLVEAVKDGALYANAKKFNQSVNSGAVEVAQPVSAEAAGDGEKF